MSAFKFSVIKAIIFAHLSGLQIVQCAGGSSRGEKRESLDFVLPDSNDPIGQQCSKFSDWFCLMGYWLNYKQSDREPQQDDREQFEQLVLPMFHKLNWYSFKPKDAANGGCCSYQANLYIEYGQKFGLSPLEYHDKIYNFARTGFEIHNLVFLKARWSETLCMNVISQVGFGKGEFKLVGSKRMTKPFVIPPLGSKQRLHIVGGSMVKTELTFGWFLHYIICEGRPDLCPDQQPAAGTSRVATPRTRRMLSLLEMNGSN
ncbi:uncharacterized protein LOC142349626 isoform X2 [Convolutriloba macropyga]|uniref:uncharacterized protein LOC142349626 isoform X2 n=1 Tax=Convolutriloba macropyga TaxID=536237 RepID=UPI003F5231C6